MNWIFGAYECRSCMAKLPEVNWTTVRNLYRLWAACPCLSWSAVSCHACVNLSRLHSGFLSRWRCALAVALHRHLCTHTHTHAITHNIPGTSYLCTYSCAYTHRSVPEPLDVEFGELKQGKMCLDTLSHHAGQGIGMFECHGMGGNQVSHHGNMLPW